MKATRHNKEKGSALLLTLGILSLVLILAMSFAFTARTNRQVSKVNADQVKAKLLAESGLARIMGGMKNTFNNKLYPASDASVVAIPLNNHLVKTKETNHPAGLHYAWIGDSTKTSDNTETENQVENIIGNNLYLRYLNEQGHSDVAGENPLDLSNCGFMTIKDDDGKIIGRVGALILEEGGKFDINQLINRRSTNNVPFVKEDEEYLNADITQTFDSAKDFYYPLLSTYSSSGNDFDETHTLRLGLLPQEIRVTPKYYSSLASGYSILKAPWFSYDHLINRLGNAKFIKGDPLDPEPASKFGFDVFAYRFFSQEEPESFIFDGGEYARFDLTGYENGDRAASFYESGKPICKNDACAWYAEDLDDAKDLIDELVTSDVDEWASFDEGGQTAIPFLSAMVGKGLDGGSTDELGKHVAANMIDFCDDNNTATIPPDYDFATADAEPAYCGNEKVPYINEISFEVEATREASVDGKTYSYTFTLTPTVELVNIFDEAVSCSDVQLRVIGDVTLTCINPRGHASHPTSGTAEPKDFTLTLSQSVSMTASEVYASKTFDAYKLVEDYAEEYATDDLDIINGTPTPVYMPSAVRLEFKILKILAQTTDGTNVLDLAFCNTELPDTFTIDMPGGRDGIASFDKICYASLQAIDPRCNHRSMDWYWNKNNNDKTVVEDEEISVNGDVRTIGSINKLSAAADFEDQYSAYGDKDKESATDQKYHNAFIKNAPFETFWELGTIHRGEPFRTIRLNKYAAFATDSDIFSYADGDAAILDQLKIGPICYSKGKFNPNSRIYRNYADVLFKGIKIEDDVEHGNITYPEPATTPHNIATLSGGTWPNPSVSRAAFVGALPIASYGNDMESEAIIGRTANLLSTRNDAYTIIIVAQAMTEFEDQTAMGTLWSDANFMKSVLNPTHYDGKYCSILGTKILTVNVLRDAWTNTFTIFRKSYADY